MASWIAVAIVTVLACAACVISSIALRIASARYRNLKFRRELDALLLECADLRDLYQGLLASHKRLAARWGSRLAREKGNGKKNSAEMSDEEWKADINRRLGLQSAGLTTEE